MWRSTWVAAVVPQHPLGYLTIWPTGDAQPLVSTMNSPDGRVKANAAIVLAGSPSGAVSVYVTDTTNIILDIDGYFVAGAGNTLAFYPLTPCRVVDTRQTNFPQGLGAPRFANMETRELPVLTNSPCLQGLPNTPQAYSFNVTAVPNPVGQSLNYLTIWPSNQNQPVVSTLNNPTATVVANAAIVPADPVEWLRQRLHLQQHRRDHRHQRLLCRTGDGWALTIFRRALSRAGYAQQQWPTVH